MQITNNYRLIQPNHYNCTTIPINYSKKIAFNGKLLETANEKIYRASTHIRIFDKFFERIDSTSWGKKFFDFLENTKLSKKMRLTAQKTYVKDVAKSLKAQPNSDKLLFRDFSMEMLEGIQYGIKVFEGLSMKDIQFLSENLHVIAVNRGCTNMCGHCYADAKPSNRQMSWEDFTSITGGFKELRERLSGLPSIFCDQFAEILEDPIYRTTELFYDSDCMGISIKDKNGKVYDMRDLATRIYEDMGRVTVFDTSGWNPKNEKMQKKAEEYVEYFSKPENMKKLEAFNLSFNVFSASLVAAAKAYKAGNKELWQMLEDKYTDRIANALFTFTPLLEYEKFHVLMRAFNNGDTKNSKHFDYPKMTSLRQKVLDKLYELYKQDYNGQQKFVISEDDIELKTAFAGYRMDIVSNDLNSSGRMKSLMKEFGIKSPIKEYDKTIKDFENDLTKKGRFHSIPQKRLIDADGKVYHMSYAHFFPTEIQLNIENKEPTPKLANLRNDFVITSELINKPEYIFDYNKWEERNGLSEV